MRFDSLASSSGGNLYAINDDMLIDCGVSYKFLGEKVDMKKIKYLLLTHEHGDHFNLSTIRKVFVESQATIICPPWLHEKLHVEGIGRLKLVEIGDIYLFDDYIVSPVEAFHDVRNIGYRVLWKNHKHIHITDTSSVSHISALEYDSASIECNHCEFRAHELIEEARNSGEFSHLVRAIENHLSVQKALDWCEKNNIKKLYPAHIGDSTRAEVEEAINWREYANF